jgi:hypothetical protein
MRSHPFLRAGPVLVGLALLCAPRGARGETDVFGTGDGVDSTALAGYAAKGEGVATATYSAAQPVLRGGRGNAPNGGGDCHNAGGGGAGEEDSSLRKRRSEWHLRARRQPRGKRPHHCRGHGRRRRRGLRLYARDDRNLVFRSNVRTYSGVLEASPAMGNIVGRRPRRKLSIIELCRPRALQRQCLFGPTDW